MIPPYALTYVVRPESPEAHLFEVVIRIAPRPAGCLRLAMPAWVPGSYMIRDFARNVVRIAAEANGGSLPLVKRDKQTWEIDHDRGEVTVRYQVFAWELSVRSAHLDTTHAYFNGASLLLRVHGLDDVPCAIELMRPDGDCCDDWRVATSLDRLNADDSGFGGYSAANFADLIDHPVEMGRFASLTFEVHGVPHSMAITGRHRVDGVRLTEDLTRICSQHAALFAELPIDRYLFLTTVVGEGYGGLEHRYSTSLLCSRDDLSDPGDPQPNPGYRRFLALCSHEYFHLWMVKRIRPEVFVDGLLDREVHTRLLWAFEGITSYYDELALVRCGCIEPKAYLQLLAETVTRVMRTPGRLLQTLAEASFDAWTKFYKQDENAPNALVSYYAKGALVALALDLTLRLKTGGAVSLDTVMRELWRRYGRTGAGVPERGIESLASEVSGLDLDDFFARALDSTRDLDLSALLASVGVSMRLRPATGAKDLGGYVDRFEPPRGQPTLGLRLRPGSEALVQNVLSASPAELAGIAPGDIVIAVDGLRATPENLDRLVAQAAADGPVAIHVFRRDELMALRALPQPALADTCELTLLEGAPETAVSARSAWLASVE